MSEQKLRIGYVTTSLSGHDGWSRYSQSVIEAVSRYADVVVLTQKNMKNTTHVPTHSVLPKTSYHPFRQREMAREMQALLEGCHVIHSMVEPYAPAAAYISTKLQCAFTMTLHGTYAVPPPGLFNVQRYLMKYALKHAHLTTSGSYNTERRAREQVRFCECRFIPNGADTSLFRILPDRKVRPYFLTTGEVKPRKGQDIGVRVLALLSNEFPELRYKIAGDDKRAWFIEQVKKLAQDAGIQDRVDILGRVSEEDLVRLYNDCTAFVLAARDDGTEFEGFPLVYFEAASCGAPIITCTGFGSEYAVEHEKTGFLVPQENPQAIADALRKLLSDSSLQHTLSHNALEKAKAHTADRIAHDQLLPFYRDAIANATRS